MKLVLIESPFRGNRKATIPYARLALAHSLSLGEAPFASHLLYTQEDVLDDDDPQQRLQGIMAGLFWGKAASLTAVYDDLGVSEGMMTGISQAKAEGRPVAYRSLRNHLHFGVRVRKLIEALD